MIIVSCRYKVAHFPRYTPGCVPLTTMQYNTLILVLASEACTTLAGWNSGIGCFEELAYGKGAANLESFKESG